jgi:hypothetical protein
VWPAGALGPLQDVSCRTGFQHHAHRSTPALRRVFESIRVQEHESQLQMQTWRHACTALMRHERPQHALDASVLDQEEGGRRPHPGCGPEAWLRDVWTARTRMPGEPHASSRCLGWPCLLEEADQGPWRRHRRIEFAKTCTSRKWQMVSSGTYCITCTSLIGSAMPAARNLLPSVRRLQELFDFLTCLELVQ